MSQTPSVGRAAAAALLLATALNAQGTPQATFTSFGSGCAGSGGTPVLTHTGLPAFGQSLTIELGGAAPNSPAFLLFGVRSAPLPFFGCDVLVDLSSASSLQTRTDGSGRGEVVIDVPNEPSLAGVPFATQWGVLDPGVARGFALSNGGDGTIGVLPPLRVSNVTGPSTGPVGTRVTVRGQNFGDDPRDFCIRGEDANGGSVLFLGRSLRRQAGVDELVCELVAAPPNPLPTMVKMMRGRDRDAPRTVTPGITSAAEHWSWDGLAFPENMTTAFQFTPTSQEATAVVFNFTKTAGVEQLEVRIPNVDPFTGAARWRKGTRLSANFDWSMRCTTPDRAYDGWFRALSIAGALSSLEVGEALADHIASAFNSRFAGDHDITTNVRIDGTEVVIEVIAEPGCTLRIATGYGKLTVDEPLADASEVVATVNEAFTGVVETVDATTVVAAPGAPVLSDVSGSRDGTIVATVSATDPAIVEVFGWGAVPVSRGSVALPAGFTSVALEIAAAAPESSDLYALAVSVDQPDRVLSLFIADVDEVGPFTPPSVVDDLDRRGIGPSIVAPLDISPNGQYVVTSQATPVGPITKLTGFVFNADPMSPGTFSALPPQEFTFLTSTFMPARVTALAFNPSGEQLVCGTEIGDVHTFSVRPDVLGGLTLREDHRFGTVVPGAPTAIAFRRDCERAWVAFNRLLSAEVHELDIAVPSFAVALSGRSVSFPASLLLSRVPMGAIDGGDRLVLGFESTYRVIRTSDLTHVDLPVTTTGTIGSIDVLGR